MTRAELKAFFETGDRPTAAQFAALIDSVLNLTNDTFEDVPGMTQALANKTDEGHIHAVSDISNLSEIIEGLETGKAEIGHGHVPGDISGLIGLFLDPLDDQYLIADVLGATFTDDLANVLGWAQGRFYYDSIGNVLYMAIADDYVLRIYPGPHGSGGGGFSPGDYMTRLISTSLDSETVTAGGDGDSYITSAVEAIQGMAITVNNSTPASNIGLKKRVGHWEVIGADTVTLSLSSDSTQGAGDKGASPFVGPWFWYAVIEYAGNIGTDMVIMNAGGNNGIKLETLSSKATIKVNSTMLNVIDGTGTTAGVSVSFKNNWVVGQKYLIAACKTSSGTNSAYLGTLSEGATPAKNLEHRTTGQVWKDDFDNLDPAVFTLGFKAGTKIYEAGYLAGEADRTLIENLFTHSLTLIS